MIPGRELVQIEMIISSIVLSVRRLMEKERLFVRVEYYHGKRKHKNDRNYYPKLKMMIVNADGKRYKVINASSCAISKVINFSLPVYFDGADLFDYIKLRLVSVFAAFPSIMEIQTIDQEVHRNELADNSMDLGHAEYEVTIQALK